MAGDWIPMRCNLVDDPAVIGISERLSLDPDLVVGKLHRIWSWANQHTIDGNAASVTKSVPSAWLDRYIGTQGFANAMAEVGWLQLRGDGIVFPKFQSWNSESAKKRALTRDRVAELRRRRQDGSGNADVTQPALPEKRREENSTEEKRTRKKHDAATWLTPFAAVWKSTYGGELNFGQAGKALKKPVAELGSEEVCTRFARYCLDTPSQFASVVKFASTIGTWKEGANGHGPTGSKSAPHGKAGSPIDDDAEWERIRAQTELESERRDRQVR